MMKLIPALIALLLTATPIAAQVFPNLKKEDVKRKVKDAERKAKNNPKPKIAPKVDPKDPKEAEKLREAFKEYMRDVPKARQAAIKQAKAEAKKLDPGVADFFKARLLARCEDFSASAKAFKKIRPPASKPPNGSVKLAAKIRSLRNGEHLAYAAKLGVMAKFDLNAQDMDAVAKELVKARKQATKAAESMKARADKESDVNIAKGLRYHANELHQWLAEYKSEDWTSVIKKYQAAVEAPDNPTKVYSFAVAAMDSKKIPLFIHSRQALRYLTDNFPDFHRVRKGDVAIRLAQNFAYTHEVDEMGAAMDKAVAKLGANSDTGKRLRGFRRNIEGWINREFREYLKK